MSIKDKIENNLTLYTLGLLTTGFIAGFGAFKAIQDAKGAIPSPSAVSWETTARTAGWIPTSECPAFPISIALTSPGTGTIVNLSGNFLYTDLVIQSTRPLPSGSCVGIIINQEGDTNYYIGKYTIDAADDERKVFLSKQFVFLPFKPNPGASLSIWSYVTTNRNQLGTVYNNLAQIKQAIPEIVISEGIKIRPKIFND
jgi:hypothetical protein